MAKSYRGSANYASPCSLLGLLNRKQVMFRLHFSVGRISSGDDNPTVAI